MADRAARRQAEAGSTTAAGPRTLINGKPAVLHALEASDEIVIGATKAGLPAGRRRRRDPRVEPRHDGGRQPPAARADRRPGRSPRPPPPRRDRPARRSAARRVRVRARRRRRATCDAALTALGAHRAFMLSISPVAPAGSRRSPPRSPAPRTTQLQAPAELIDKVVNGKQIVTAETGGRALIPPRCTAAATT